MRRTEDVSYSATMSDATHYVAHLSKPVQVCSSDMLKTESQLLSYSASHVPWVLQVRHQADSTISDNYATVLS